MMNPFSALHIRILMAAGMILVILGSAAFFFWPEITSEQQNGRISPKNTGKKEPVSITRNEDGWWESRRLIYYNIPARVTYRLPDADREQAEAVAAMAWAEFDSIGDIFNPTDPNSETGRLNAADKTEPVRISKTLYRALQISKRLWRASNGAFDPTTSPVKKLWERAVETQQIPTERQIHGVLSRTGLDHVRLLEASSAVVCDIEGITFDFGGIAKGLAVDRVSGVLKNAGITAGLVQLGGEIAAFGNKNGQPWRVGIQHPTDMQDIWGTISTRHSVHVSTSGNYRQPLIIQGHPFYHIFSPKTGRPVPQKVLGVTTAGFGQDRQNALLDAAATAITVLGPAQGLELAKKLHIQALILTRGAEGKIREHATPGFSNHYAQQTSAEP